MGLTNPATLLQALIRFDTTNPPGNEAACLQFVDRLLRDAGLPTRFVSRNDSRPNLIAHLPGRGAAPPLLLQGHVDVVTTAGQQWTHPPFAGEIHDGLVWGRGALDMKGGVAMMITALLRQAAGETPPAGDIILCLMSDEENGGAFGADFLTREHPDLFAGVRFGIGEFGGFPLPLAGTKFYPIQVAERVGCALELTLTGPGGHGALPLRGGAMARLGQVLTTLDRRQLPVHLTPVTRMMVEALAAHTRPPASLILRGLLNPRLTAPLLARLGQRLAILNPLFRHTVNATVVQGGEKQNVIPSDIRLILDGRLLPGSTPEEMIAEVQALVGKDVTIRPLGVGIPQPLEPNMGLFPLLSDILRQQDPDGVAIPYLLPAVTDGRYFARLGIQHYGFLPLNLPPDFHFSAAVHAANERVPITALDFGTQALTSLLQRYNG